MRALIISDISCVGRCSVTAMLPILTCFDIEAVPLPTALLSSQTGGIDDFTFAPLGRHHAGIIGHWKRLGITFDAVITGYFAETANFKTALTVKEELGRRDADGKNSCFLIVDPVLGDNGKLYQGMTESFVRAMKRFIRFADVILPNLTEAEILTDSKGAAALEQIAELNRNAVVTGIEIGKTITAAHPASAFSYSVKRSEGVFHGAGDVFSAVFSGGYLSGFGVERSTKLAADFCRRAVVKTVGCDTRLGLNFEAELPWLINSIRKLRAEKAY
jgi:pyridoxine kinase